MIAIALLGFFIAAVSAASDRCMFVCTADYRPVCGNDLKTYPNECAMRGAACEKNTAIVAVYNGECKETPNECAFPCTREYLPVCGSDGQKYPTECAMRAQSCKSGNPIIVVSRFAFEHTDCASDSACNIPCTRNFKPVCGSDGQTYSNECGMVVQACKSRTAIIKVTEGSCKN